MRSRKTRLVEVHARLFPENVVQLKKLAAESGISWQTELRLLVRRALAGESRPFHIISEDKS